MEQQEFNLSKMRMSANQYISYIWYDELDVKEFIKILRDDINKNPILTRGQKNNILAHLRRIAGDELSK